MDGADSLAGSFGDRCVNGDHSAPRGRMFSPRSSCSQNDHRGGISPLSSGGGADAAATAAAPCAGGGAGAAAAIENLRQRSSAPASTAASALSNRGKGDATVRALPTISNGEITQQQRFFELLERRLTALRGVGGEAASVNTGAKSRRHVGGLRPRTRSLDSAESSMCLQQAAYDALSGSASNLSLGSVSSSATSLSSFRQSGASAFAASITISGAAGTSSATALPAEEAFVALETVFSATNLQKSRYGPDSAGRRTGGSNLSSGRLCNGRPANRGSAAPVGACSGGAVSDDDALPGGSGGVFVAAGVAADDGDGDGDSDGDGDGDGDDDGDGDGDSVGVVGDVVIPRTCGEVRMPLQRHVARPPDSLLRRRQRASMNVTMSSENVTSGSDGASAVPAPAPNRGRRGRRLLMAGGWVSRPTADLSKEEEHYLRQLFAASRMRGVQVEHACREQEEDTDDDTTPDNDLVSADIDVVEMPDEPSRPAPRPPGRFANVWQQRQLASVQKADVESTAISLRPSPRRPGARQRSKSESSKPTGDVAWAWAWASISPTPTPTPQPPSATFCPYPSARRSLAAAPLSAPSPELVKPRSPQSTPPLQIPDGDPANMAIWWQSPTVHLDERNRTRRSSSSSSSSSSQEQQC